MKKLWGIAAILLLFTSLTGCSNVTEKQAAAIEEKLQQIQQTADSYCTIQYDNLQEQLDTQQEKQQEKDQADYTLKIRIPDVSALDRTDVSFTLPDMDLNAPDPDAFAAGFEGAAMQALEDQIVQENSSLWQNYEIDVVMKKADGNWNAVFSENEVDALLSAIRENIGAKCSEWLETEPVYQAVLMAGTMDHRLEQVFPIYDYQFAARIDTLEPQDDGSYAVTLTYPDPQELFSEAKQLRYDSYVPNGLSLFDEVTQNEIENAFKKDLEKALKGSPTQITKTLIVQTGDDSGAEWTAFSEEVTGLYQQTLDELYTIINQDFVHPAQGMPETSILSGSNSGQKIRIKGGEALADTYVAFYKLSANDLNEEGTLTLSAFIKAGESKTVHLPSGNYKMIQGVGHTWYGESLAFGPNGLYSQMDEVLNIESNYEYTLTMYAIEDGNLSNSTIPYPY